PSSSTCPTRRSTPSCCSISALESLAYAPTPRPAAWPSDWASHGSSRVIGYESGARGSTSWPSSRSEPFQIADFVYRLPPVFRRRVKLARFMHYAIRVHFQLYGVVMIECIPNFSEGRRRE